MAENQSKPENKQPEQNPDEKTNPGTPDAGALTSADSVVAAKAGLTEGKVKELRHTSGMNQLAGNEANTLSWEASPAGQEFLKGEKDRKSQYEKEAKDFEQAAKKDRLTEAEVTYKEAVAKARKG